MYAFWMSSFVLFCELTIDLVGFPVKRVVHFQRLLKSYLLLASTGLCPGLNNVIRELVHGLENTYRVNSIWGVTGGYNGFSRADYEPVRLSSKIVENIHHEGGTFLRTSRGGLDIEKTVEFLTSRSINHLYIIGGSFLSREKKRFTRVN